jgi:hypothetical protein
MQPPCQYRHGYKHTKLARIQNMFEATKGVIRSLGSKKYRQYNGKKKKDK